MPLRHRFCLTVTLSLVATTFVTGCARDPESRKQKFLASGDKYFERKDYAAAAIEYRSAVQIDARFGPARLGLARAHERLGAPHLALAEYVRAADLLPDDHEVQLTAGGYLLTAGRFDEAKARAEAVLQKDPKNVRAHVVLGNAMAGLRDMDQAVLQLEEAIRIDPLRGPTYANLGMLHLARGQMDQAEKSFSRSVDLDPKWVPGHLALANYFWARGRRNDAERELRTAFDLDPTNAITNRAMAVYYLSTGRAAEAEPHARSLVSSGAAPFALADFYLLQNRPLDAIPELQRLRDNPPTAAEAGRRLVQAHALAGNMPDANRVVDDMLGKAPDDTDALLLKGSLLSREGKRDEAYTHLAKAASVDPNSARLQYALGLSYAARGDLDQAKQAFNEALRLNPRAAEVQIQLARLELTKGQAASSVQLARDAVRQQPANLDAQVTLIRGLIGAKDIDGAKRTLAPLFGAHPNSAVLHTQLGLALATANDRVAARRSFERAIEIEPGSPEALGGLLALDANSGNHQAARARVDAALKSNPNSADLWVLAARAYSAARDTTATEAALKRAIELEPGLLRAYSMLGQLYLRQGRLADARREYESLAQRHAKPVAALTMLGMIAQLSGDQSSAQAHFERAVDLEPRAPIAANNLAWIYADRGERLDFALQLAQTAARELPKSSEVRDTLGWVHYKRNTPTEAIAAFLDAVRLASENPTYHYHLGLAYALGEKDAEARQSMRRALALSGNTQYSWTAGAERVVSSGAARGTSPK